MIGALAALLLFSLFPLWYAVVTSLRSGAALFTPSLWGGELDLSSYADVFRHQPFARNIVNSIVVGVVVVAVSLVLAVQAAFALGRIRFRGRSTLLVTILMVSMFPQVAVLSGMFELVRALGLYDSLPGLMLANLMLTLPFTVWVLTTFMRELPKEIEEAALVDGASTLTLVWRIFLPLMWPALVSTGLLAFVVAWNEFLFALTFTLSPQTRTVPVAIALLSGASAQELPWGQIMAASVIVTVPVVALILVFQRKIVSGLSAGAVKG
ncbi:MAG TPA: carbohydrate ABC transporter permease [Burkholderiaceae bacterium]|nr:carbohydrate ABC transporter permease [Burkholderiaceae bacterium]